MTLETIATFASIIASVAVVLSLIFIGLQLRQNMHLTRMSTAHTSAMLLSQNYGRVIENADLAKLLADSDNLAELHGADLLRITNFVSVSFRYFEILHTHKRYNVFEPELWGATEARLKESLGNPRVQNWWQDNRQYYAPSFSTYVDDLVRALPSKEASAV